jgi:formylglycine-generating enzyme required for sulfatase activity
VRLEAGSFIMGWEMDTENPPHEVHLTRGFRLQRTPVTQAQWMEVMGANPSHFTGDDLRPVEDVSFEDVQRFLKMLGEHTGIAHRLPTDAEWEYAFRAGQRESFRGRIDDVAWYKTNSNGTTQPVATLAANAWGLYDMHGNVCEWTQDIHAALTSARTVDPTGPASGLHRVVRGGSWFNNSLIVRSPTRGSRPPQSKSDQIGLRLVRHG